MTGFGQATCSFNNMQIVVEVKSLNSKFVELNLRLPRGYSDKELELRQVVSDRLERGKITVSIDCDHGSKESLSLDYNEALFTAYYSQLKKLADRVMAPYDHLFQIAINAPEVVKSGSNKSPDAEEWLTVMQCVGRAIDRCDEFRKSEGGVLHDKLIAYGKAIASGLVLVESRDTQRIARVRERIKGKITDFFGEEGYDRNRLEQEIIFYVEKLDIHEECVRLKAHLDYFVEVLGSPESNGKKLGFIAQEIGREINTIGSKANDAEMQKQVVMMKEELEKIKEQLGNIL